MNAKKGKIEEEQKNTTYIIHTREQCGDVEGEKSRRVGLPRNVGNKLHDEEGCINGEA
jgi:hypothetical protein